VLCHDQVVLTEDEQAGTINEEMYTKIVNAGYLVVFQADDRRTSHFFFLVLSRPWPIPWSPRGRIARSGSTELRLRWLDYPRPYPRALPFRDPITRFETCAEGWEKVHLTILFVATPDISSFLSSRSTHSQVSKLDRSPRSSGRWSNTNGVSDSSFLG
jgi:hypothetical protein